MIIELNDLGVKRVGIVGTPLRSDRHRQDQHEPHDDQPRSTPRHPAPPPQLVTSFLLRRCRQDWKAFESKSESTQHMLGL